MPIFLFILLLRGLIFFKFNNLVSSQALSSAVQRMQDRGQCSSGSSTSCLLAPAPSLTPFSRGCSALWGAHRGMLWGACHPKEKVAAGDGTEPAGLRRPVWSCLHTVVLPLGTCCAPNHMNLCKAHPFLPWAFIMQKLLKGKCAWSKQEVQRLYNAVGSYRCGLSLGISLPSPLPIHLTYAE